MGRLWIYSQTITASCLDQSVFSRITHKLVGQYFLRAPLKEGEWSVDAEARSTSLTQTWYRLVIDMGRLRPYSETITAPLVQSACVLEPLINWLASISATAKSKWPTCGGRMVGREKSNTNNSYPDLVQASYRYVNTLSILLQTITALLVQPVGAGTTHKLAGQHIRTIHINLKSILSIKSLGLAQRRRGKHQRFRTSQMWMENSIAL